MSAAQTTARKTIMAGMQILLGVWLIALSVLVGTIFRAMVDFADREYVETSQRLVQVLEMRIADLADSVQTLEAQPELATAAVLHETRQRLEARLIQMELALANRSDAQAIQALRTEVEQLKTRSQPTPIEPPPQTKPATPVAAAAKQAPFPFRVVASEVRAGQRSVSVVPLRGELTADKIQVILSGETVGQWRLQAIEANTAVFQNGNQTRRLIIP